MAGAPGGLVVTTDEQSAGPRPPGAKLVRAAGDRPALFGAAAPAGRPPPSAAGGAAGGLRGGGGDGAGLDCALKWPNDVWIDERKLAGVLIESRAGADGWAVIGVGLNVAVPQEEFPAELAGTATSLLAAGGAPPRSALAARLLNEALGRWVDSPAEAVLAGSAPGDALAAGGSAGRRARASSRA